VIPARDVAALARLEHVGDDPRHLEPFWAGGGQHEGIDLLRGRSAPPAARAAIFVVGARDLGIDAARRQAIEEIALGADVDVAARHGQRHDLAQRILDRAIVGELQGDARLDAQRLAAKQAGTHGGRDGALDDMHGLVGKVLVVELLRRERDQRPRTVGIGVGIGALDRLGCQVVAAVTLLLRQQPAQRLQPPRAGLVADFLLEHRHDVALHVAFDVSLAPVVAPTQNFQIRPARADRIGLRTIAAGHVLLHEKVIENLQPVRIGFFRDSRFDGAHDALAGQ